VAALGLAALIVFLLLPTSGAADAPPPARATAEGEVDAPPPAPATAEGEVDAPPPHVGTPRGLRGVPLPGSTPPGDEPGQTRVPDPDEIEAANDADEQGPKQ